MPASRVAYTGGGLGVELVGGPEVQALLRGYMAPELDVRLFEGLKAGSRVLTVSIKAKAPRPVKPGFGKNSPYKMGDIAKSVRSKRLRGTPPAYVVGPSHRARHLSIIPTRAHDIHSSGGHLWAGNRWAAVVHHPGNHPHPWVKAGIDAGHARAVEAAASRIFQAVIHDTGSGGGDD